MATVPIKSVLPETLEERFQRLAADWQAAVAHHSSDRVRCNHPAYQEIIGMGEVVVPLLLRDEDAGKIAKMKAAWLRWGREHGVEFHIGSDH